MFITTWAQEEQQKQDSSPDKERSPKVLFADDDTETLDLYRFYAQSLYWQCEFVSSAREALEYVDNACRCRGGNDPYDCIVMDVNFFDAYPEDQPRLTGITAGAEIRRAGCDVPIIFVTGYPNVLIRNEAKEITNLDNFFEKPLDLDALFDRIEFLVNWHRAAKRPDYNGPERRRNSINRTDHQRRSIDARITVPKVLDEMITEARSGHHYPA